jgi:hypothetical protein
MLLRPTALQGKREESPDTEVSGRKVGNRWATRLITSGEQRRELRFTESATENIPPVKSSTVAWRRETCKAPSKC